MSEDYNPGAFLDQVAKSGKTLTEKGVGAFMNSISNHEWGDGSVTEPRFVHDEDKDFYQPSALPDLKAWQNQWEQDPTNKSLLGLNGEKLPDGAISWDKYGRPYFGVGFDGILNHIKGTFLSEDWWNAPIQSSYAAATEALEAQGVQLTEEDKKKYEDEFQDPTFFGKVARGVGGVVDTIFNVADMAISYGLERVIGTPAIAARRWTQTHGIIPEQNIPSYVKLHEDKNSNAPAPLSYDSTGQLWEESWNASRIFYSAIANQGRESEYIQEVRSGTSPEYAALMHEDPKAEMIGRIFTQLFGVDTLGVVSRLSKVWRGSRLIQDAKAAYVATREVEDWATAIKQIRNADDAVATEKIKELADIALDATQKISGKQGQLAGRTGVLAKVWDKVSPLTASSKQHVMSQLFEPLLIRAKDLAKQPDDYVEFFESLMKIYSGKGDEVADGIAFLKHYEYPDMLFSEAAQHLGVTLNKLVGEGEDITKFVDRINEFDKVEELAGFMGGKVDDALESVFPSVAKRLEMGEYVDPITKTLHATNKAASVITNPLMQFYSRVYMGWNMGFAVRNYLNNTVLTLIDEGMGAFRKIDYIDEWATKALGGLPEFAEKTMTAEFVKIDQKAAKLAEAGKEITEGQKLLQKAEKVVKRGPFSALSQKFEEIASKQVFYSEARRVLKSGLENGAVADMGKLLDMGMPEADAKLLRSLVIEEWGDVNKALERYKGMTNNGLLEVYRSVDHLVNATDAKLLEQAGVYDELQAILARAKSREEAILEWQKVVDELERKRNKVLTDHPVGVDPNWDGAETARLADSFDDADDATKIKNQIGWNSKSNELYRESFQETLASLRNGAKTEDEMRAIWELEQKYQDLLSGRLGADADKDIREFMDSVGYWSDPKGAGNVNLQLRNRQRAAYVQKLGGPQEAWKYFGIPGDPPAELTIKQLYNALWDDYAKPKQLEHWNNFRDVLAQKAEEYIQEAAKLRPDLGGSAKLEEARSAYQTAKSWESGVITQTDIGEVAALLDEGEYLNAIQKLGQKYGIDSPEHLINALNKYGDTKIDDLRQLNTQEGFQQAADILAKREAKDLSAAEMVTRYGFKDADEALTAVNNHLLEEAGVDLSVNIENRGKKIIAGKEVDFTEQAKEAQELAESPMFTKLRQKKLAQKAGVDLFNKIDDVPPELAKEAFEASGKELSTAGDVLPTAEQAVEELIKDAPKLMPVDTGNLTGPTVPRIMDNAWPEWEPAFSRVDKAINDKWGHAIPTSDRDLGEALIEWASETDRNVNTVKTTAIRAGTEARNFSLVDYGVQGYGGAALGHIFPWYKWYGGQYKSWISRLTKNADVIGAYSSYRDYREKEMAGLPDWWKHNITTDLFGTLDNPIMMNLEATLNPLYSITGTDFNNPDMRVNWWTKNMSDLGKIGPSVSPIINLVTAIGLWKKGQDDNNETFGEAASLWAGRLFPQTRQIKALGSIFSGGNVSELPLKGEFDPFVHFFSGGLDPYERKRVGKALGAIVAENPDLKEQAIEAARTQSGELWEEAINRAVHARAGGDLTSFMFGVGFKGRTRSDMEIDNAMNAYYRLWQIRPNLHPDEWRNAMNDLSAKYPFLDTVLLSRKGGPERDTFYAFNIMNRLPPGASLADVTDVPQELISKFYDDKGDMREWGESDRLRFMSAVVEAGAKLAVPDDTTQEEWNAVRDRRTEMNNILKGEFGEDILDMFDVFYGLPKESKDAFLKAHPEVEAALDRKGNLVFSDPLLSSYYGGIDFIDGYLRGQMWEEIEKELGSDIWDKWDYYFSLSTSAERKKYKREHPELTEYSKIKEKWEKMINQNVVLIGSQLPEPLPATSREGGDIDLNSPLLQLSVGQWEQQLGQNAFEFAIASLQGQDLTYVEEGILEDAAKDLGIDTNKLVQYVGLSMMPKASPPPNAAPFDVQVAAFQNFDIEEMGAIMTAGMLDIPLSAALETKLAMFAASAGISVDELIAIIAGQ